MLTDGVRPDWFDARLFPVESRWLDVDGCSIHYVDEGSGPTLLMLHGNPTWSFLYRRLIAGLADRFRCVALDYPGFGLSGARAGYGFTPQEHAAVVTSFVRELDLRDATPIVQDWGGPIGLSAVLADRDRYSRLIIGNTWAWPMSTIKMQVFSELMGGSVTGGLMSRRFNAFVGQIIPRSMRRRELTDAEMAMYRGPFPTDESRVPVQVFPREITKAKTLLAELADRADSYADLPTLLLWADADIAFGPSEFSRWNLVLDDVRPYVLHGAGHYWQDDAGEEAALAIRSWWDGALVLGDDPVA
ncbi:MAG: alpha/beta fold hydrolase [Actinobacteria bacterium]|nr:alpha/beta fold hydrolase [Actinomycetota bacterium]